MARFLMGSKRPINSVKHVIDTSGSLVMNVNSTNPVATAVVAPTSSGLDQVPIGCTISSVFISLYVLGSSGSGSGLIDWYIRKNPGGTQTGGDQPIPGSTGSSALRRFIFHEEKGLAATQDGTPMVFKGVIKIPPRFRRMGEDDELQVVIRSSVADLEFCFKAIYKHYI